MRLMRLFGSGRNHPGCDQISNTVIFKHPDTCGNIRSAFERFGPDDIAFNFSMCGAHFFGAGRRRIARRLCCISVQ